MLFELITNGLTMGKAQSRLAILIIFMTTINAMIFSSLLNGSGTIIVSMITHYVIVFIHVMLMFIIVNNLCPDAVHPRGPVEGVYDPFFD